MEESIIYGVFWFMRGVLVFIIWLGARRYYFSEASHSWPTAEGTIIKSSAQYFANPGKMFSYIPDIKYVYYVGNRKYKSERINFSLNQGAGGVDYTNSYVNYFQPGRTVSVFYDPNDPARSVLEPGMNKPHFWVTMMLGVICIGGIGFANHIF